MKFWQRAVAVFCAMAISDVGWTAYMTTVAKGQVVAASLWSSLIVLIGGYVIVAYTDDHRLLAPAALGAAAGTAATMLVLG